MKEIGITTASFVASLFVMLMLIWHWGDWNSLLATLLGALVGWLLGLLLSPFAAEKEIFATYAKAGSAFFTGYLVSKFDRIFEIFLGTKSSSDPPRLLSVEVWRPSVFMICSLVLVLIYTFTCRHYGQRANAEAAAAKTRQVAG